MDEFEVISLDRLQLLRSIEVLKQKGGREGDSGFNNQVYEVFMKTFISFVLIILTDVPVLCSCCCLTQLEKKYLYSNHEFSHRLNEVERDQVSHFILRLAYCRTEELRRWYVSS